MANNPQESGARASASAEAQAGTPEQSDVADQNAQLRSENLLLQNQNRLLTNEITGLKEQNAQLDNALQVAHSALAANKAFNDSLVAGHEQTKVATSEAPKAAPKFDTSVSTAQTRRAAAEARAEASATATANVNIAITENSTPAEIAKYNRETAIIMANSNKEAKDAASRAEAAAKRAEDAANGRTNVTPLAVAGGVAGGAGAGGPRARNAAAGGGNINNKNVQNGKRRGRILGYLGAAAAGALITAGAFLAFGNKDEKEAHVVNVGDKITREHNQNESHHKTANQKRIQNLHAAENAKTVPAAVKKLHSTPENIKKNIHGIMNENDSQIVLHGKGSQSSQRTEFTPGKFGAINGAEAVAFTSVNSPAYANMTLDQLTGGNTPDGLSHEQVLNRIESILTADGAKFDIEQPTGSFLNHGQHDENIFVADILNLKGNTNVFTITAADGHKMYVKITNVGGGSPLCLNILTPTHISKITIPPVTPGTPGTPPESPPKTPPKTPPVTPPVTPPHHPGPKHDSNTTPGGVPGENGGTPDVPGNGPAGQTPNGSGYVPGEHHPATPPQAPTPAPLPENPAPTPTAPAETGVDNGPNQPVAPSTGTGTTVPTQDTNPQG